MNEFPGSDPIYAVVATVRALLLIELKSKQVTPLEWNRPEYYGITWQRNGLELIVAHSMLDTTELRDISSYALSEVGVLSEGAYTSKPFLSSPHQITSASDGRVICANTGRNSISIFNPTKPNLKQEVMISDVRWDRLSLEDQPGDHLNSVFEKDGILYAIAHRHGKGSALAKFSFPDLDLLAVELVKNRTGLHNIWVTDDGQEISCHSEAGSLIDLISNTVLWDSGSPVYTRGLAASSEFVLIGESERAQRASRRHSMSGLWLIDRSTWQAVDYFCLGPYGGVHEVRLLNVKDEAHHSHLFAGLNALLKRDPRKEIAADRLTSSKRAQRSKALWKSLDLIFGTPVSTEDGGQVAASENLCLMVQRPQAQSERSLKFSFSIAHSESDSHMAIVAYRGQGGDVDMDALLIQRISDIEASMSHWIHDGLVWSRRDDTAIVGLPLSGDVRFSVSSEGANLIINGQRLSGNCIDDFPTGSGVLGIRWVGATIWPPAE
ncbi:hypothetical protein [Caballeronia sordidicola]|uniref:hypothetical protein n=1 Tax=Caballeronia sordidicola TaxID=196367 RepID=UPI000AA1FD33|nr:hypothetical protein [Caballeronia sordidicola]